MNTRTAIQPSNDPNVLSVAFSSSRSRFIASLSDGLRVFRTDNCLTTDQPTLSDDAYSSPSVCISEALDDRHIAFVPRTDTTSESGNVVLFWDCLLGKAVCKYDLHEPILGLRLNRRWMAVILKERTVLFAYQEIEPLQQPTPPPDDDEDAPTTVMVPNQIHALYPTSPNIFALASLRDNVLVLPAQSLGQVQVIPLPGGSKRVIRAHNSSIRHLALSADGTLLATASESGTLIRVFDTRTTDQIAEYRRGMERAIVFSLAFSPSNRWLASTSDKGTLHIFDLRPSTSSEALSTQYSDNRPTSSSRRTQNYATHRLSGGGIDKDSLSAFSGRSSPASTSTAIPPPISGGGAAPAYQGSVQEYYGLRPPPGSATAAGRETAITAMSALKASSWAPKALKDTRSVASAPFWMGNEGPYWQQPGGGSGGGFRWTTTPTGVRKRVRNPVLSLPGEPSGRPVKGVIGFAPEKGGLAEDDDQGAVVYVVGGGNEGRWEVFFIVPVPLPPGGGGTGLALVKRGFRRFLQKQFVD